MIFNKEQQYWDDKQALYSAREIAQQPTTWLKTLEIVKSQWDSIQEFIAPILEADNPKIIFTGAGTSEFVGNSLQPLFAKQHRDAFVSIATTDLVATPDLYIRKDQPTLLVSFGRSGNSPESIGALDVATIVNPNTRHLVITCNHEGNLAKRTDASVLAVKLPPETNDLSFAMTSSFSNMFLAAYAIFNFDNIQAIEAALDKIVNAVNVIHTQQIKGLEDIVNSFEFDRIVYLGDASLKGFAQESALKMLEQSAGEVVTMHNTPLGFRHGPKSIINATSLTVVYLNEDPYLRQYQADIIKEMSGQRQGNQIVAFDVYQDDTIASLVDAYFVVNIDKSAEDLLGLVYVNAAQIISLLKSIKLGKSPDNPWPSGMVNRVVQGVTIYPYLSKEGK